MGKLLNIPLMIAAIVIPFAAQIFPTEIHNWILSINHSFGDVLYALFRMSMFAIFIIGIVTIMDYFKSKKIKNKILIMKQYNEKRINNLIVSIKTYFEGNLQEHIKMSQAMNDIAKAMMENVKNKQYDKIPEIKIIEEIDKRITMLSNELNKNLDELKQKYNDEFKDWEK